MRLRVLFAVLVFAPTVGLAQQQKASGPETVALRFGWPQTLSATIESERIRVRKSETLDSSAAAVSYQMQAGKGKGKELLIRFSDFELQSEDAQTAPAQELMEQVSALVPSYRVNMDGEFLGVHEVARLKAYMDSAFAPLLEKDHSGQLQSLFKSLVSEQYLNGVTAQEWNALVGMWVGADLELGQIYELEEEAPIPMIPGAVVKMLSEFAIEDRVSCEEGGTDENCVQIRLYSEPDSVAMKAVLQQFMSRLAAGAATEEMPVFEDLSIRSELLLITRPETLMPYYMEMIKVVEGRGRMGTESTPFSQVDRRRYWYTYN